MKILSPHPRPPKSKSVLSQTAGYSCADQDLRSTGLYKARTSGRGCNTGLQARPLAVWDLWEFEGQEVKPQAGFLLQYHILSLTFQPQISLGGQRAGETFGQKVPALNGQHEEKCLASALRYKRCPNPPSQQSSSHDIMIPFIFIICLKGPRVKEPSLIYFLCKFCKLEETSVLIFYFRSIKELSKTNSGIVYASIV